MYMTAHEIANELLKLPADSVVCFNNGKGLLESVKTITCSGHTKDIRRIENANEVGLSPKQEQDALERLKDCTPSMWVFLNLDK